MSISRRVTAIVLSSVDKGESDKFIKLFAANEGIVTALAKGARKPSAKLKFAAQTFNFGVYDLEETRTGEIVTGCEQINSFYPLTKSLDTFYAASVSLEVLGAFRENDLFRLSINYLYSLEENNYHIPLLGFLLDFLTEIGGGLSFNSCATCQNDSNLCFDTVDGGILCSSCAGKPIPIPLTMLKTFRAIKSSSSCNQSLDIHCVTSCINLISKYIGTMYQPIKSLNNLLTL